MMKKHLFFGLFLSLGVVLSSCSKDETNVIEPAAAETSENALGDPILVTKDAPLILSLEARAALEDAEGLWLDRLTASDIAYGFYQSPNGYMNIHSSVSEYLHWTNMTNEFGDPGFNVFKTGTLRVSGRYEDLLEDYWVAILIHVGRSITPPQPYPLVVAVSSEYWLDCNFIITYSNYLAYHSYDRKNFWDIADSFRDYRLLWLTRDGDELMAGVTYMNGGSPIYDRDINQIYTDMLDRGFGAIGNSIHYKTYAYNELVFGDTSEFGSYVGRYPGDDEDIKIGTIYLFEKP